MNCIVINAWRRPGYLAEVLDSLTRCTEIGNYTILVGINPCGNEEITMELLSICKLANATATVIMLRTEDVGANLNVLLSLEYAFELFDYVIHLQDDTPVAPDALRYFEWARQFGRDPNVFTVTGYRHPRGWMPGPSPKPQDEHVRVGPSHFFTCYGWATWRDRWHEMRANWPTNYWTQGTPAWDTYLCYEARKDRVEIAPYTARTRHIGVEGGMGFGHKVLPYWAGSAGFVAPQGYVLSGEDVDFEKANDPNRW